MEFFEPYIQNRGLFIYSDPGGAKPVLYLAAWFKSKLVQHQVISNRDYSFAGDFNITPLKPFQDISEHFDEIRPDFVFTGTSYTGDLEWQFVKEAKRRGIKTLSFVDHWTRIKDRFSHNMEEVLPDIICLVDERAKQIAMEEGIEAGKLLVTKNPFHHYLQNWRPKAGKADFFNGINIPYTGKKVIVFAPDPLSAVNGIERFGYDELLVANELAELIPSIADKFVVIFKPHPNQRMDILPRAFANQVIMAPPAVDNNSLIYYSDIIMGFFSNYLLEAQVMGKRILRYIPETGINDPFKEMEVGTIVNKINLLNFLKNEP